MAQFPYEFERKEKLETKKDDQYFEEIIDIDENISKDFEFLSNAPISENDHFVFQSEKDWTVDISKYSEFFTIDLKTLSAAIEAIPFNNNVNIDTKYFTDDQITDIYNNAERGKEKYNKILNTEEIVTNIKKDENKNQDSLENTAEELDFLLSCREPINDPLMIVKSLPLSCNIDSKIKTKSNTSTKSLDLEKWLDSILDD
ncbi:uncharacterized protein LOC107965827 [Apis mellifera]|uniref:Uncharacterized protein LOC107965827 n=1 Tax=Apis mellifera TaxID=7460 RepID=A0A7M7SQG4_APIME|nr:uncharacterized protein LOC107965827 [Apis mellifera]|eukprot:XP_026298729.1 uncharacterized protein LOC107965827 [Apis mellifera]